MVGSDPGTRGLASVIRGDGDGDRRRGGNRVGRASTLAQRLEIERGIRVAALLRAQESRLGGRELAALGENNAEVGRGRRVAAPVGEPIRTLGGRRITALVQEHPEVEGAVEITALDGSAVGLLGAAEVTARLEQDAQVDGGCGVPP